jgi:ABC-type antimicrobial peptide transport system permease subunit
MTELLNIGLAAGRSFSEDYTDTARIVFNETAIAAMGLEEPIGKVVKLWNKEMEIVGVVKDFHFQSLHETVKPLFFFLNPERTNNIVLKIKAGTDNQVIKGLLDLHKVYNPGFPLDYQYLDQEYQAQYVAENRVSILSKYFAGLAILISCLGLFGLASFTAERRIKEIGIRKVLGASEWKIMELLSGDFAKMILASIVLALPLSYFITKNWLDSFAYHIDLEWWYFIGAGAMTMLIALLTVSFQSVKAALMNPVESLRSE